MRVDTVALARRLVRDEVPDCRLGTLASRFRLDHKPTHRALDDALATTDLLHLLIERASALGVLGLDDLTTLASMAGHPQAAKLKLTSSLPRSPGVYLFCGHRDEVLYVGKATNLRQRVRSYFGQRGPPAHRPDAARGAGRAPPLPARPAVGRGRRGPADRPRSSRATTAPARAPTGTATSASTSTRRGRAWRSSRTRRAPASTSGRCRRERWPTLVVEALQAALPLRRCSVRLGRTHVAARPAPRRARAAQMGVAACPCAGAGRSRARTTTRSAPPSRR